MDNISYLLAANAIIWVALGGYMVFVALGQKTLTNRVKQLETLRND